MNTRLKNAYLVTIDIDWAPDTAIDAMSETLMRKNVKATWFVTHQSPAIERLKKHKDLFELGIHPNFLPNSTHGKSFNEIMDHVLQLVPDAVSVRTHALVQSSVLLRDMAIQYPIRNDCSLFLRETPSLQPHVFYVTEKGAHLTRFPFFWEDDTETYNPAKSWDIQNPKYHCEGLKILNFHPLFVYLNIDSMKNYESLKALKPLREATEKDMEPFINKETGAGTFFEAFTSFVQKNQTDTFRINDLNSL